MNIIVAGSRNFGAIDSSTEDKWRFVWAHLDAAWGSRPDNPTLVSGGATGIDRCGELWAESRKVPVLQMPANWSRYGNIAGPIRNEEMATIADRCIVFWDGKSRGSKNMIDIALKRGLHLTVIRIPQ